MTIDYHECGHAVAAALLGGRIDLLTIEPDNDDEQLPERSGEIRVIWPPGHWTDRELAIREIKVSLAGPIVEMIYEQVAYAPEFLEEWRYDWQHAIDNAVDFLPRNVPIQQHLGRYVGEVMSFFQRDDVWAAVAALADELDAHGTLELEQIEAVLEAWPLEY